MTGVAEHAVAGLRASEPHALPFAPSLEIRAFVLERAAGDIAVYSAPALRLDGVARHYLNHSHEAMFPPDAGTAPLFVHVDGRAEVERTMPVRATFSRRHTRDDDFEVIPTPGHTPGTTAFLWDTGDHRALFTGDTIFLRDGEWATAVLDSSDPVAYADSLRLIRDLDFDVLVPWAAGRGEPYLAFTDREDTRRRIDALLARLEGSTRRRK
jgi:glyoxylase-like metal-dependent hydrolase (beta-lactamase superfamily II)